MLTDDVHMPLFYSYVLHAHNRSQSSQVYDAEDRKEIRSASQRSLSHFNHYSTLLMLAVHSRAAVNNKERLLLLFYFCLINQWHDTTRAQRSKGIRVSLVCFFLFLQRIPREPNDGYVCLRIGNRNMQQEKKGDPATTRSEQFPTRRPRDLMQKIPTELREEKQSGLRRRHRFRHSSPILSHWRLTLRQETMKTRHLPRVEADSENPFTHTRH